MKEKEEEWEREREKIIERNRDNMRENREKRDSRIIKCEVRHKKKLNREKDWVERKERKEIVTYKSESERETHTEVGKNERE